MTAENKFDFITIENHAVVMEEGQTSSLIIVDVRFCQFIKQSEKDEAIQMSTCIVCFYREQEKK